jgi:hypothetical protein
MVPPPHCGEYEVTEQSVIYTSVAAVQGRKSAVAAISHNLVRTKTVIEWTKVNRLILNNNERHLILIALADPTRASLR